MKNHATLHRMATLFVILFVLVSHSKAQEVMLTEDFSGTTNIFGVSSSTGAANSAWLQNSNFSGFGNVLAVCNTTVNGSIRGTDGNAVAVGNGTVTIEWDAFHGYLSGSSSTTVSLLNSADEVLASYTYAAGQTSITNASIGGATPADFAAFSLQSKKGSGGANGWGGNSKPYSGTSGDNPHVAITMTARGGVTMTFTLQGSQTTLHGSLGSMTKDVAKLRIYSNVGNTDRCYAIDNISVSKGVLEQDENYVEQIIKATISGPERMTFGPSPDEASSNSYTVVLVGADGTIITEDNLSEKVTDFKVDWDIEGFRTANDTEGQYCDSYGSFSINGEGRVQTSFDLRDVPMNFFGCMTSTVTYHGETIVAKKYVTALGNQTRPANRILPLGGYPVSYSDYPSALNKYILAKETYGASNDLILGGWCVAGSDGGAQAVLVTNANETYVRFTSSNAGKSHVMTQKIDTPTSQIIACMRLRFNAAGATVTLTGGYPFWSASKYTCPVTLSYNGSSLQLNGSDVLRGSQAAAVNPGTWYEVVLSADKTTETCYVLVLDSEGNAVGESGVVKWSETSSPTYFNIGMNNNGTGTLDIASCELYVPSIDTSSFKFDADRQTLSIPQGESARLNAVLKDDRGYPVTQKAEWTVLEDDMRESVVITPDDNDSHVATVSLSSTAEAGTATIQVNIGGNTKTLALLLTSSAESLKFTKSVNSISIPTDESTIVGKQFAAVVIDGDGQTVSSNVVLALYDKSGTQPFQGEGISFDPTTGVLSITSLASPVELVVRATGRNTSGEELTKNVRVNIHGMSFDFGYNSDDAVATGYTLVGRSTSYSDTNGYGIVSGTAVEGGMVSDENAEADYLQGAIQFDVKVQPGNFYDVQVTYQGKLTSGYVNSDLSGYTLGTYTELTTETYKIPATLSRIDLHIADADATHVARIAKVVVTKKDKREKRGKRVVHHIGDSTSANNGSWAYRLKNLIGGTYPELAALCDFHNDGAGGRNLCTYYTEGKLYGVLCDIYPGDILMFGNNGTNGMGATFEADMNYYLDAAETLGAQIIINSYTPHGAVGNYSSGYNSSTHQFNSYRKDSYDVIVRRVAEERAKSDDDYLGFVEIGKNADALFNAYVADYAANNYDSADDAAQAIIQCFSDHNHYKEGTLACDLMLGGYKSSDVKGIVAQLVDILTSSETGIGEKQRTEINTLDDASIYTLTGVRVKYPSKPGIYIVGGKKRYIW